MGFNLLQSLQSAQDQNNQKQFDEKKHADSLLLSYYQVIDVLPARSELKRLLKKCIYGILTGQKIDAEIQFIKDVKILLNKIRDNKSNYFYLDLIQFLTEVYQLAVDRQIEQQLIQDSQQNIEQNSNEEQKQNSDSSNVLNVEEEIIRLFQNNPQLTSELDFINDEDSQQDEEDDMQDNEDEFIMPENQNQQNQQIQNQNIGIRTRYFNEQIDEEEYGNEEDEEDEIEFNDHIEDDSEELNLNRVV